MGAQVGICDNDQWSYGLAPVLGGLTVIPTADSEANLGGNLLTNPDFATLDFTGWTAGLNWSAATGAAVRTAAAPTTLAQNINVVNGRVYQIDFTLGGAFAGAFQFDINGVVGRGYLNSANWTINTRDVIVANATGVVAFAITPDAAFNGTIDNIWVREVTRSTDSIVSFCDSAGVQVFPFRASGTLENMGIGYRALSYNTSGEGNFALGYNALGSNVTGHTNVALGVGAMTANRTGYRNVAIGHDALVSVTHGTNNIAIGGLALDALTTAFYNIGIGVNALGLNATGDSNTAIGTNCLFSLVVGVSCTAVGAWALANNTANCNTAVGMDALYHNIAGDGLCAMGWEALRDNTASNNTAIGACALQTNIIGAYEVAVGRDALRNARGDFNTAIGWSAGLAIGVASGFVGLGCGAGYYETESNKLFIDNSTRASEADARIKALIYGIFDAATANQRLRINGHFGILLSEVPTAANNAAAQAAGCAVGDFYRTNADPSILCIRSV